MSRGSLELLKLPVLNDWACISDLSKSTSLKFSPEFLKKRNCTILASMGFCVGGKWRGGVIITAVYIYIFKIKGLRLGYAVCGLMMRRLLARKNHFT